MKDPKEYRFDHCDYWVRVSYKPSKPGCWDISDVDVFKGTEKIGRYERNYSSFYNTFWPFEQDGKWYALYSKDYTGTSVMSLPDCKEVCGEKPDSFGFCPTNLYVPKEALGQFGFVAGCIWGDDYSWKIQFLDLSQIKEGKLIRDDRFGYISMAHDTLAECIEVDVDEYEDHEDNGAKKRDIMLTLKIEKIVPLSGDEADTKYVYINGKPDEQTEKHQVERLARMKNE